MKRLGTLVAVVLLFVLAAAPSGAQQFGTLSGRVVDDGGLGLPGVSVTLSGPALQGNRLVQSDNDGNFRFTPIPPGKDYKVAAALEGFMAASRTSISVPLNGEALAGDLVLRVGGTESVTVEAGGVTVDTSKTTIDTNIDWKMIDTLATNRSFQTIMSMAPGTQISANPYSPANNPKVHGSDDDDNLYLINGFNQTDPRTLTWGNAINYDTIAEVQLQTAGFEAEFGRTSGGVINLVTKSGGNEVHGTFRLVWADRDFQSDTTTYRYCDPSVDESIFPCEERTAEDGFITERSKTGDVTTTELRPSATVGGFLMKDKLWYYLSYEGRSREQDFTRAVPVACPGDDPEVRGLRCLSESGVGTSEYKGYYGSAKLTWQINPSYSLVGYYNTDPIDISNINARYGDPYYSESSEQIQKQGGYLVGLNATAIFNESTFGDLKVSNYDAPLDVTASQEMDEPFYYDLNTGYWFGDPLYDYRSVRQNQNLNLSVSKFLEDTLGGSHQIKAGVEYLRSKTTEDLVYNPQGIYYAYIGDSGGSFDNPLPDVFVVGKIPPAYDRTHKQDYIGVYLQNKFQRKGLTLNFGVRAESLDVRNNLDEEVVEFGFGDAIMPRLGVAYDLSETGLSFLSGSAVHGGWARYRSFASSFIGDNFDNLPGYQIDYYNLDGTPSGDDPYLLAGNLRFGEDEPSIPYVDEWSAGYDQKLGKTASVGINHVSRRFRNPLAMVYAEDEEGDYYYQLVNLDLDNTRYKAWEVTVRKAFADDRLQFMANYTYAYENEGFSGLSAKGAAFAGFGYGACPEDYCYENLYGDLDSPHTFKLNGSYTYEWFAGLSTLGISDYYSSGALWTPYTLRQSVTGGYSNELQEPLGSREVGSWNRLDIHLEHQVTFEALAGLSVAVYGDVFNVLNRQSALNRSGYRGFSLDYVDDEGNEIVPTSTQYGYPTRWQNPRVFQFGVKLEF